MVFLMVDFHAAEFPLNQRGRWSKWILIGASGCSYPTHLFFPNVTALVCDLSQLLPQHQINDTAVWTESRNYTCDARDRACAPTVDVIAESFRAHLHLWISSLLRYQLDVSRLLSGGQLRMQLIFFIFIFNFIQPYFMYIFIFLYNKV